MPDDHGNTHGTGHAESVEHGAACVFCNIIKGQIPAKKIADNMDAVAFLDINPRSKGHTVVVPKHHAVKLTDLPSEKVGPLFETVQEVAAEIVKTFDADGYNIGINNGELAGQAVPHVHVHIIPRYKTDKHHAGFEAAFPVDEEAKKSLEETFKELQTGGTGDHHMPHKENEDKTQLQKQSKWKFLDDDRPEED